MANEGQATTAPSAALETVIESEAQKQRLLKRAAVGLAMACVIVLGLYHNNPSWLELQEGPPPSAVPIEKRSLISVAKKERLKVPNKMALAHNVSTEKVQVAVIAVGEKVRSKLGGKTTPAAAPPLPGATTAAATTRKGVISTIHRNYKFEEMFIEHPDLLAAGNKLKELTIQKRVKSVYVTHAIPNSEIKEAPAVLLLHGAKFSSSTWEKINTVQMLVDTGFHVYTMDLPGYGRSEGKVDASLRAAFLKGIIVKLELVKPFIVAPSMSGSYVIPYIAAGNTTHDVSGAILIAPTGVKDVPVDTWKLIADETHVFFIYGEQDEVIGKSGAKYLEHVDDIQFFKVREGTHPCYLDKPKQFHKKLRAFLIRKVSKGRGKKFFITHRDSGGFDTSNHAHMGDSPDSPKSPKKAQVTDPSKDVTIKS